MSNQTQLPPDVQARVDTALAQGLRVRWAPVSPEHPLSKCPNCNGSDPSLRDRLIAVQIENSKSKTLTWWDQLSGMVKVETLAAVCPVCTDHTLVIEHLWQASGLNELEQEWRLDYLDGLPGKEVALQAARDMLAELPRPRGWLTVYGDYGRGKSGLLKSTVAACIRAGIPARYFRAEDFLAELRKLYDASKRGEQGGLTQVQLEDLFVGVRVAAVDELERTSDTDWAMANLHRLLDRRYNARGFQATLLASNLAPVDLPDRLRYLGSRMLDGRMIRMGGKSLRGQAEPEAVEAAA